jgi:hypothetical protein
MIRIDDLFVDRRCSIITFRRRRGKSWGVVLLCEVRWCEGCDTMFDIMVWGGVWCVMGDRKDEESIKC